MDTTTQVLVILLSVTLTMFLIVMIVAGIYFIQILKEVKKISLRAENVAGTVETAAEAVTRAASPLAVLKLIGNIVEQASKRRK
jgi:hypothetical protein